jgi:microcystin-dependent protein
MVRLSVLFILLSFTIAAAQVPQTLSYQGLITDAATGNPLNGAHSATFNFYTSATGGSPVFSRGPLSVTTFQGLFTVIIGNSQGNNNSGLPNLGSVQYYIGLTVDTNPTDLTPRVALTAVPYAFTASSLDANASVLGSQVGTGINASNISTGTLSGTLVGSGVSASNISGTLNGSQVGNGINASNISAGTLNGTLVGTGINASNITTGTLSGALVGSGVSATNITGTLNGSQVGTGINAANITSNTLPAAQIGAGTIDNSKLAAGIDASKITTGTLPASVIPSSASVPQGTIIAFAGLIANIPAGWLECNGQSLSTASPYDKLFAAIGNTWGSTDATHFNVPNLLGYFLRGWSHGSGTDPDAGVRVPGSSPGSTATGDAVGSYQPDAFQGHLHTEQVAGTSVTSPVLQPRSTAAFGDSNVSATSTTSPVDDGTNGTPRTSKESRPKNAYVIYIIKY